VTAEMIDGTRWTEVHDRKAPPPMTEEESEAQAPTSRPAPRFATEGI